MRGPQFRLNVSVVAVLLWLCAGVAYANVYPSGVTVDTAGFNEKCGTLKVSYVLNEDADGGHPNPGDPGVKIEVLDVSDPENPFVVRTVTIARQKKGTHTFEWDGREDDGSRADNGTDRYAVKITAADQGYSVWTQISLDQTTTSFYVPVGLSVNRNAGSLHYGSVYVSNATTGTTAYGRANPEGIYRLKADMTEINSGTAGVTWGGTSGPWKSAIGTDDRVYVTDLSNDLVFDVAPDLSAAVQLIDASNRTTNQWVGGVVVEGTQAAGNRKIYLANVNYNDTARKGLIQYTLDANPTVTASDTGVQYIGPSYYSFYPYDYVRDSVGDWYGTQYRYDPSQAEAIAKFLDSTTLPINTAFWTTPKVAPYNGGYCLDICEERGWVAYGNYYDGFVHVFNTADGSYIDGFDAGSRMRDIAFDAAGNIYTVDNSTEWLRVWSPDDGANSKDYTTAVVSLGKTDTGGPSITVQPTDVVFCPLGTANLSVTATGSAPADLTYQWKKNGKALTDGTQEDGAVVSGATIANLTLSNVPDSYAGSVITVVVCDQTGADTGVVVSGPAILKVGMSFIEQPASQTICQNTNVSFSVGVEGSGTITYQWEKDPVETPGPQVEEWALIDGATSSTLSLTNVPATESGSRYRCGVRDACNPAPSFEPRYSEVATLIVRDGPTITHVGYGATLSPGASHKLLCDITAVTGNATFQWKKDTVPIPGATNSYYWIINANCDTDGGVYSCEVTDDCGTKERNTAYTTALCEIIVGVTAEVCGNDLDDDCDGLLNCDDPDCDNDPNCVPPCPVPFADVDGDEDVDQTDFATLQLCFTGQDQAIPAANADLCRCLNWDGDLDIDGDDVSKFEACASGPGVVASKTCAPYPTGDVVINEISYDMFTAAGGTDTDDDEFVELYNRGTEAVDISGWTLRASPGNDYIIGGSTWLAAGDYYVIGSGSVPEVDLIISTTDIWANDETAIELLDKNQTVKDTVIYERYWDGGPAVPSPEGGAWGQFGTATDKQSLARYKDGLDTGNNGYDFGLRPLTPGKDNLTGGLEPPTGKIETIYTVPDVDTLMVGALVDGLTSSCTEATVINPTVGGAGNPNPLAIAASPQGGNAIIVADLPGGDMVASNDVFQGGASYDLWVYLDTTTYGVGGGESTTYGIVGTTDFVYRFPNPDSAAGFGGDVVTSNGNTGVGWVYQKETDTSEPDLMSLSLCDFGPGGDSSNGPLTPADWDVKATLDMKEAGRGTGWYRLKLKYTSDTGLVEASVSNVEAGGSFTYSTSFQTQIGLVGSFYVGYRESLLNTDGSGPREKLRPATFDSVAP
ncbi:MAG: lamin tail domain-containing protein [Phycisphaerae bacterium]|nr:lamin tail domain-containing protein [Phycisphaerae bacterium]